MDINSMFFEMESIDKELVRLRDSIKKLNSKKKQYLSEITKQLQENDETEYTYKGTVYKIIDKTQHSRKGDKQRKTDTISVLNEAGYYGQEADDIYSKLAEAWKGEEKVIHKLKSTKTKAI